MFILKLKDCIFNKKKFGKQDLYNGWRKEWERMRGKTLTYIDSFCFRHCFHSLFPILCSVFAFHFVCFCYIAFTIFGEFDVFVRDGRVIICMRFLKW